MSWNSSCRSPYLPTSPVFRVAIHIHHWTPSTYSIIHVSHDNLPQFHMSDPPDSSLATLHSYPPKQSSPPFPPSAVNTELRFSAIRYHHCPRTSKKSHAADREALPLLIIWTFSPTRDHESRNILRTVASRSQVCIAPDKPPWATSAVNHPQGGDALVPDTGVRIRESSLTFMLVLTSRSVRDQREVRQLQVRLLEHGSKHVSYVSSSSREYVDVRADKLLFPFQLYS
jgi:hypothetical protein